MYRGPQRNPLASGHRSDIQVRQPVPGAPVLRIHAPHLKAKGDQSPPIICRSQQNEQA